MLPESWIKFLEQQRLERESQKLSRKLRPMRHAGPTRVQIGSHDLVNFSSNDYLGLAADLRVAEAAAGAAGRYGWGTGASRLVTGSSTLHMKLEAETASFRGTKAALVYGSGYQANIGVLSALAGPGDTILSDSLNHASIVAGCRLSGAKVKVFRHLDLEELEHRLSGSRDTRTIVVTDSIFSIRGDIAELPRLARLCQRFNALLVVDDAHANACIGRHGRGLPEEQEVLSEVPVVIGTYSKALGSYGGFVACDEAVREHLLNVSRPFIYTTAMPIALAAANIEALRILKREGDTLRGKLAANYRGLRGKLVSAGFKPMGRYHIVGLPMESTAHAMFYAEQLEQQGLLVYPMRWPSVPKGEDTLRISLSAAHTEDEIARLVSALKLARDRSAGKSTGEVKHRSSRRPTQKVLSADTAEFDIEQTGFGDAGEGEPLGATMQTNDSGGLEIVGEVDDFGAQDAGTKIIQRGPEPIPEEEEDWTRVGFPGDASSFDDQPAPKASAPEDFDVVEDDPEIDGVEAISSVHPVPDDKAEDKPEPAKQESKKGKTSWRERRKKRKRKR